MTQLRRKVLTSFTLFLSLWNHVSATILERNDTSGSSKNRGQSAIKLSHTKSDSSTTNHVRGSFTEAFDSDKRSGDYKTVRKVPIHPLPDWTDISQEEFQYQAGVVMKTMGAYQVETSDYHNRLLQADDDDYKYGDDDRANAGVGDDGKLINIDQDKVAEVIKGVAIAGVIVALDRFESGRSKDNDDNDDDAEESNDNDDTIDNTGVDIDYLDDDAFALIKDDFDENDTTKRFDKYMVLFVTIDDLEAGGAGQGLREMVTGKLYSSNGLYVGKYYTVFTTTSLTPDPGTSGSQELWVSTYMLYGNGQLMGTLQIQGLLVNGASKNIASIIGGTGRFSGAAGLLESESRQLNVPLGCTYNANFFPTEGNSGCAVGAAYITLYEYWEHEYLDYDKRCEFCT